MRLLGRLNAIENKVVAMEAEQDGTVEIPVGVWLSDENGNVIPGSGPVSRVPKEQVNSFGIMLVPRPCQDKEDFAAEVEKCNAYQAQLVEKVPESPVVEQ